MRLGRLVLGLALVVAAAWLTGQWRVVLGLSLAAYLAWQLYNRWRLQQWLAQGEQDPPESLGAWSEIFDRIHVLQRRNRSQYAQQVAATDELMRVTNAFPDASLVIDQHNKLSWFNEAARDLLGLKTPADLGHPVTNLVRDPDFADWLAVQEHLSSRLEMPAPHDENRRLMVSAVRFGEGQRLVIMRDISDIHNLERIRRDFVANVSHELRTPLTVLQGYLESIRDQCPEDLQAPIERMYGQATQMGALINDLLELARLQSDEHASEDEHVDVPAMLAQLGGLAEELSQGAHRIGLEVDPDLKLRGIPADLESAFRNLIQNAVHYTPAGGHITVSWQDTDTGPQFSVADDGPGIPRKDIPRLTERFYRVGSDRSRKGGGTGLGLAIVKHILSRHQAELRIESEPGKGSRFTAVFPAARIRQATPATRS
jgi:two-component system phosphate regulon sensor histidine kinase PhoR